MIDSNIFLDHNSTTPLNSRVLEAMLPYLSNHTGNPTSRHSFGRGARQAIDFAREQVADAVGAHPSQVIFTSGGSESNNLAITGIPSLHAKPKVAISTVEHPCVTKPALAMQKRGWHVEFIEVDENGLVNMRSMTNSLNNDLDLLSIMLANNETGVIQPIAEIASLVRSKGTYIHTDAVQAFGKIELDFNALNVHAMTLSSHKINGPQGVGALVIDKSIDLQPIILGGGQEKGMRSGTENLAGIVGFGAACEITSMELKQKSTLLNIMRTRLEIGIQALGGIIFGQHANRIPNTSFFAFKDIEGETLVMAMDRKGYAIASGSACSSDSSEPSHVLLAMNVEPDLARGAVRVSLGASNTMQEIDGFLQTLKTELNRLKQLTAIAV